MLQSLFLHYFDTHFLEEVAGSGPAISVHLTRELDLATRLAIVSADEVLIPAASYFERPECRNVIDTLEPIFDSGLIYLVGGGSSTEEYLDSKLDQYRPGSPQRVAYEAAARGTRNHPPFRRRQSSTTLDIVSFWKDALEMPAFASTVFGNALSLPSNLEELWAAVPEKLGADAFIVEYVYPLVFDHGASTVHRNRLHGVINQAYFASYAREFHAGMLTDLLYLGSQHNLISGGTDLPFRAFREALRNNDALAEVVGASPATLMALRHDPRVVAALKSVLVDLPALGQDQLMLALQTPPDLHALLRSVEEVKHGRATASKYHRAVERFLTAAFEHSLVDPHMEEHLDGKTRRADILYRNVAIAGFFLWASLTQHSPYVVVECKNYANEVGNQELDQVIGYFAPWRTRVGFLVCRSLTDRGRMIERCRYAAHAQKGIVIVLEDADLARLADFGCDPRWKAPQSGFLRERLDELLVG